MNWSEAIPAGYEARVESPHVYILKQGWEERLLPDLRVDLEVPLPESRKLPGRGGNFSYQLFDSKERIVVRQGRRGGLLPLSDATYFGAKRVLAELSVTEEARGRGVLAPEILAIKITRAAVGFYRWKILSREITEAQPLQELLPTLDAVQKRAIARAVAKACARLHSAGITHADLTIRNILVQPSTAGETRVHFVDFDKATAQGEPLSEKTRQRMLRRLNRSLEKWQSRRNAVITRSDGLRFLTYYLEAQRAELKRWARACSAGLWLHRIGWRLSGQ